MRESLSEGIEITDVIADEVATVLTASITSLRIDRHLVHAIEAGVKTIDATPVEAILSRHIDGLRPKLPRHGYDLRAFCTQFDARSPENRKLLRDALNPQRSTELLEEQRTARLLL